LLVVFGASIILRSLGFRLFLDLYRVTPQILSTDSMVLIFIMATASGLLVVDLAVDYRNDYIMPIWHKLSESESLLVRNPDVVD
jgi:hypothetical protein